MSDKITAETVAAPHSHLRTPVVGKRLLVGASTRHGEDARDADKGCDDGFGEAGFGQDEQLAELSVGLHLADDILEEGGGHALTVVGIAPRQFVHPAGGFVVSVSAPEQQHVLACIYIKNGRKRLVRYDQENRPR